jgi:hypothetical protein
MNGSTVASLIGILFCNGIYGMYLGISVVHHHFLVNMDPTLRVDI